MNVRIRHTPVRPATERPLTRRPVLSAAAGALVIAFSAPLVRLAEVSPSTAAVFRCAYALPVLGLLAWLERSRHGPADARHARLALVAGFFFAADLTFWHHSIAAVGAGLATVLANVQVVLVGVLAWALLRERPDARAMRSVPVVLVGVVLISGAVGSGAYGKDPALGVLYGLLTALAYAVFLLILRGAGGIGQRPAGPLFLATLSAAVFAFLGGLAVGDFDAVPGPESQAWLVTLALTSQVLGWLLISIALPRVPALITSIVLTIQPIGSVILGAAIFGESPSAFQLAGVALILGGVVLATARAAP
jgi:drug/metabolite transporter (DMT)-like permease